ncbi:MAG: DUF1553 domain-containing protein [Planctomycetota bacterium]
MHPCHDNFASIGAGFCFPLRFKVEISSDKRSWETVADFTRKDLSNPLLSPVSVDFKPQTATLIRITATKLRERKNDFAMAIAEIKVHTADHGESIPIRSVNAKDSIEAAPRWSKSNLTDDEFASYADADKAVAFEKANAELKALMQKIESNERHEAKKQALEHIDSLKAKLASLPEGKVVYAAATHFKPQGNFKPTSGKPRPVHVLHRGNITQPLTPATPGVLPLAAQSKSSFGDGLSESELRAAFAEWLSNPENPFVWRSIVNRVWLYHFGQGLVDTPNDFGRMGAKPTHPELLDWLAIQFRDGNQSLKDLHRLIVTSNTYQQSSAYSSANSAIDGSNQYLWRASRRRLSAEEIRDSILAVSGSLNPEMGGPGYYLFALEKTAHSPHYEYHKFDPADVSTHRRSIYRFIVRSQPDPWMTTLDCADSSQSTPKRNETLTALQALALLNNKFNLEMAKRFAEDLRQESPDLSRQVNLAFHRITQREPTKDESKRLEGYAAKHGLDNLCRFLFNLSEFVFVD